MSNTVEELDALRSLTVGLPSSHLRRSPPDYAILSGHTGLISASEAGTLWNCLPVPFACYGSGHQLPNAEPQQFAPGLRSLSSSCGSDPRCRFDPRPSSSTSP
ncbi:hypothetical protein SESBI_31451 [Sesbania bispinosa]|nr:hypothetical protein SESBI_31451 [Sesbania bispinosa]